MGGQKSTLMDTDTESSRQESMGYELRPDDIYQIDVNTESSSASEMMADNISMLGSQLEELKIQVKKQDKKIKELGVQIVQLMTANKLLMHKVDNLSEPVAEESTTSYDDTESDADANEPVLQKMPKPIPKAKMPTIPKTKMPKPIPKMSTKLAGAAANPDATEESDNDLQNDTVSDEPELPKVKPKAKLKPTKLASGDVVVDLLQVKKGRGKNRYSGSGSDSDVSVLINETLSEKSAIKMVISEIGKDGYYTFVLVKLGKNNDRYQCADQKWLGIDFYLPRKYSNGKNSLFIGFT